MTKTMNAKEFYEYQLNDKTSAVGIQGKEEIIMLMEEYYKHRTDNTKEPKGKLFCECKLPSMDMRGVCFKCDSEVDIDLKSHNTKEPAPTPGEQDVTEAVIKDLQERSAIGEKKYGTRLQTHNGRKALVDLYQELLDACQYIKQELLERESGRGG